MSKVMDCYHCGNRTQMNLLTSYKDEWSDGELNIGGYDMYSLYKCPVCKEVTLEKSSLFSEDIIFYGNSKYEREKAIEDATINRILFPEHNFDENIVPENVKKAFEAALKIRRIEPNTCAVAIRRTLEMICKDKKAKGSTLVKQLEDLATSGTLPVILGDAAFFIRRLGNTAAHANNDEVSYEQVNQMIEFTEAILEYVYVIPSKISKIKQEI